MRIDTIAIENYKCFLEKQEIIFAKGFNLLIGKNNSGKTTALELTSLPDNINGPHRSERNLIEYMEKPEPSSSYSICISTKINELRRFFGDQFFIPLPNNAHSLDNRSKVAEALSLESPVKLIYYFAGQEKRLQVETPLGRSDSATKSKTISGAMLDFKLSSNGFINADTPNFSSSISPLINHETIRKAVYRFSALRTPRARYSMENGAELRTDAENLAFCINHLQTNDSEGHLQLCTLLNRIFPEIKWIQAPPSLNQLFELQCLPVHPDRRRNDLAISIDKMGTGIGNIIAIPYVLLTSRFPQVIAIDEPNSFLHPKALRELLQILESHGKEHQYILTGHSPEVLTAIEPSTITYFEMENSSSTVKQFTKGQFHELRSGLSDLGIRMTDLHARDQVLWVEGQTEELIFPSLLRAFCPLKAAGTAVLRVTNTGRFEQKGLPINEVADAYQRLTNDAVVPPLVTILLDKEGKTDAQVQELMSKSKILKILPLRMIENYVLDTDAIHHVMQKHGSISNKELISRKITSDLDLKTFDGAKLLKTIFADSEPVTINYSKTTHTVEIFEWLLENKPDVLEPLKHFIENLMRD